jgi:hypothetical protein
VQIQVLGQCPGEEEKGGFGEMGRLSTFPQFTQPTRNAAGFKHRLSAPQTMFFTDILLYHKMKK